MRHPSFHDEAETCRRKAAFYEGKPEAEFLLSIARSFEELASASSSVQPSLTISRPGSSGPGTDTLLMGAPRRLC
jgi:hypothetical protein